MARCTLTSPFRAAPQTITQPNHSSNVSPPVSRTQTETGCTMTSSPFSSRIAINSTCSDSIVRCIGTMVASTVSLSGFHGICKLGSWCGTRCNWLCDMRVLFCIRANLDRNTCTYWKLVKLRPRHPRRLSSVWYHLSGSNFQKLPQPTFFNNSGPFLSRMPLLINVEPGNVRWHLWTVWLQLL